MQANSVGHMTCEKSKHSTPYELFPSILCKQSAACNDAHKVARRPSVAASLILDSLVNHQFCLSPLPSPLSSLQFCKPCLAQCIYPICKRENSHSLRPGPQDASCMVNKVRFIGIQHLDFLNSTFFFGRVY